MPLYRLWADDADHGTAEERVARVWQRIYQKKHPDQNVRIEPVEENAPAFLPRRSFLERDHLE
jgi:hypothetical protein